jgi:hypothetical protein
MGKLAAGGFHTGFQLVLTVVDGIGTWGCPARREPERAVAPHVISLTKKTKAPRHPPSGWHGALPVACGLRGYFEPFFGSSGCFAGAPVATR